MNRIYANIVEGTTLTSRVESIKNEVSGAGDKITGIYNQLSSGGLVFDQITVLISNSMKADLTNINTKINL